MANKIAIRSLLKMQEELLIALVMWTTPSEQPGVRQGGLHQELI